MTDPYDHWRRETRRYSQRQRWKDDAVDVLLYSVAFVLHAVAIGTFVGVVWYVAKTIAGVG